jgi:predicted RNA-binding Zn-ribbon protein involved in translation (DUF1610 family)
MTFINKKENRVCDDCGYEIKVGDLIYLESDVKFICKNCVGDNYKSPNKISLK